MAKQIYNKLELSWIGKGEELKLEPRILIHNPEFSYGHPNSENMLIYGDNLLALKALEEDYLGKIKCIYIDPPYNTGHAFEHYDDGLEHSQWLNLMYPRLKILKKLLHKNGSIWISIDSDEGHYLKIICDEIFGRNNFIDEVIWQRSFAPINLRKTLSRNHDLILVYAANSENFTLNKLERSDRQYESYKNLDEDERGPWTSSDCSVGPEVKEKIYEIVLPSGRIVTPPKGRCWLYDKKRFKQMINENRIWFGKSGNSAPRVKKFLSEVQSGVTPMTIWLREDVGDNQEAKKEVKYFNEENVFQTPKPERLIKRIIELSTNEGDIVLDSFLGSGTTASVAHKMKRKWIGIELGEHIYSHAKPRLDSVIKGENRGISKQVEWEGGGGYKFYRLANSILTKDEFEQLIISKEYSKDMIYRAIAKLEGFKIITSDNYWKQGKSSENDFIYTLTSHLTVKMLDEIHYEMKNDETLLICSKTFDSECLNRYPNISIKKIPNSISPLCDYNINDYNF